MFDRSLSPSLKSTAAVLGLAAATFVTLVPAAASAQGAPPPPPGDPGATPPPAGYPPPGGYAPPPPGYAPQGGYYAPPGAYAAPGPRVMDYEEGQPVPPGYHKSTKIRTGLVVGGAVTFGVVYLITASVGAVVGDVCSSNNSSCSNAKLLLIPVVGPFTLMGSNAGATGSLFLALDGLAQAAGVAMFAAGLAAPRAVLVRNDVAKVTISPKPITFGKNGAGIGLTGTF